MLEGLTDHPQRYPLTNELHARPFQPMKAPGRLIHIAMKKPQGAAERDPAQDRAHLTAFLDRHGAPHPAPEANHYFHDFGRFRMKWERHTEFVSYTFYEEGPTDDVFASDLSDQLPADWLSQATGAVVAAVEVELIQVDGRAEADRVAETRLAREFHAESLAVARVLDDRALAMGDFRIHEGGFTRFALLIHTPTGPRRVGRIIQRLLEIETYRAVAMLALPIARRTAARLNEIERSMTRLIDMVAHKPGVEHEGEILSELTGLSAELEALAANTAFRFGAAKAYEALVKQRIETLREQRVDGRQLFSEFMTRRFDPAMRTCHAAERRLGDLATRAGRIAELLRTRVNVAVEAQNQRLLESMDQRAALQLRLQETVEGLSVVAISYYAVSLAGYVVAPFASAIQVSKETLTALIAVPTVLLVWGMVRRLRRRLTKS